MSTVLIGVLVYVALQLGIGVWVARRIATEDDYLLAGRRLGYGLATLSFFATWFGAETCLSSAGRLYVEGLSGAAAWWLALQAETIFGLVESASAFGSAGIFVVLVLGLFTRFGRSASALAALGAGTAIWIVGTYVLGWEVVHLFSLAGAVVAYGITAAFVEHRLP